MAPRAPGWPAELSAGAVLLRPPRQRDGPAWSEIRLRNEQWLHRWEPTAALGWADRHRVSSWPPVCSALRRAGRTGSMLPFVITYDGSFAGQVNVSNVVHGVLRSASIGYWIDARWAGRGIVPTAVALVIDHCFTQVGLHRIEINIRPENEASLRVVSKLGLRREGYYERYLDIDHGWRDHLAFAITSEELQGQSMLSRLATPAAPPNP
jgi:[ribosomal protein S5]-alanine N-acetyltransferase